MVAESIRGSIEKALKGIEHPEIACTLFELGMIGTLDIQGKRVTCTLKVPMLGIPIKEYLINSIKRTIYRENNGIEINVNVEEMNEDERTKFMHMAQEAWKG